MLSIRNWYKRILQVGIDENMPFAEKMRIEQTNLFFLVAIPMVLIHIVFNIFHGLSLLSCGLGIAWLFLLFVPIIFNYFKLHFWAKFYIVLVPLFFVALVHCLYGWGLRLEPMYITIIVSTWFVFKERLAYLMTLLAVLVYINVCFYLENFGAPYSDIIISTTPFLYFAGSTIFTIAQTSKTVYANWKYHDLTTQQTKALVSKNEELERFNYIVSHDLKSPLRNVVSFSDLIEREIDGGNLDKAKTFLSIVKTNATQMSNLIHDILEVSKIKEIKFDDQTFVNPVEVIKKVMLSLQEIMEQKNATIEFSDLPELKATEAHIFLLFQNLIQNGVKYNESEKPTVKISGSRKKDVIILSFEDNGIGIEPIYYEKIFDYFKRLHNQSKYQGTGIGLGICKKIMEGYGGEITVESSPGKGSKFTIVLPGQS